MLIPSLYSVLEPREMIWEVSVLDVAMMKHFLIGRVDAKHIYA